MKAWVLDDINKYSLQDVADPVAQDNEVLIEVKACGICGSDIPRAFKNGAHKMPIIIGHEFSGEVAECRSGNFSAGDRVGVFPLIPCMECAPCRAKKYEMCRHYNYLGSRCDGGFAQKVSVPEWNLIKLPDGVSYKAAAMLEPMAVAVHAMRQLMDIDAGISCDDSIVIYGLGTIGTLLALFLKDAGYKKIYALGNKDFQKDTFVSLGFDEAHFCDTRSVDAYKWIMDKTFGEGANHLFECIGKSDTIEQVFDMAMPGGSICLVGNPYSDIMLKRDVYWKILRNQLKISGTWNSSFAHDDNDDWHYVLDRIDNGSINPEVLITHELKLQDVIKGFEIMRDKSEDYIKVMMCR